jgi:transcriptional/translational regulatory protein YebC/TACO1
VVLNDDGSLDVITSPDEFSSVKESLTAAGFDTRMGEVTFNASTSADLDQDNAERLLKMVDALEDLDDVQEVYHNADISDEIMAALDA